MNTKIFLSRILFIILLLFNSLTAQILITEPMEWYIPVDRPNRQSWDGVELSAIGQFGVWRKARPTVPGHHHTGNDIKRPHDNYIDEPVFPAAAGLVISLRADGPYAQIIVEHTLPDQQKVWTVYEHVAGIKVRCNEFVTPDKPLARFMSRQELDKYGWQFDHFHFEVMRAAPQPAQPDASKPCRFFNTWCLLCFNEKDLYEKYYYPIEYLETQWKEKKSSPDKNIIYTIIK